MQEAGNKHNAPPIDFDNLDGIDGIEDLEAPPPPQKASASIKVSANRMTASIVITPPEFGGDDLASAEICGALRGNNITYGLIYADIFRLGSAPSYNTEIVVARGKEPVDGIPASIDFKIRREKHPQPRENADGSVDYKDLGIIENVRAGDVLCIKIPAKPGTDGINVFGQPVPSRAGKDCNLPAGKNTLVSPDKLHLLASVDGQVEYINGKINILNTFTIDTDVSIETGNVVFVGNVIVRGNVNTGYKVQAEGNIDIYGIVEGATIISGGNVMIRGGFNGMGKGEIQADGNVTCKFVQAGKITSKGYVEAGFAYNTVIQSGEYVKIVARRGIVVGGHIMARTYVQAPFYGGRNSRVPTLVEVGNDPQTMTRSYEIPKEIDALKKNIAAAKRLQSILIQLKDAGRLLKDDYEKLEKVTNTINLDEVHLADIEQELVDVKEKLLETGNGMVRVTSTIFPGVKIIIGTESITTDRDNNFCYYHRSEKGGITTSPLK